MMNILPNMEYYSIFSYCTKCPKGYSRESDRGRTLMTLIKNNWEVPTSHDDIGEQKEFASAFVARVVSERPGLWPGFFGPRVALVPIPRSKLSVPNELWVPKKIAEALEARGMGRVFDILERKMPVPTSHLSKTSERPSPEQHYESLSIKVDLLSLNGMDSITLVDDVITRGSTMLGSASLVHDKYPNVKIVGFAALRAISNPKEFVQVLDPTRGIITYGPGGGPFREP